MVRSPRYAAAVTERPYHHGNVRAAMVEAAVAAIAEGGTAAVSMRALARRVGVTHGAAAHHFGDKTGLLTAVAAEGFRLFAAALEEAYAVRRSFREVGVAYVRFAVEHPAHFALMFRPDQYRCDDPEVLAARAAAGRVLYESAGEVADATDGDVLLAGTAGWAYVHGIATLWRDGNLPPGLPDDPVELTERIGPFLFQRSKAAARERRAAAGRRNSPIS